MKNKWARCGVAVGMLAGISATCPATASASVATWHIPDLTKGTLQNAMGKVSALLGDQAQLVLLQPGKPAPKDAPADTLYIYPVILKGDMQPVHNLANWEVCKQTPHANGILTLTPKTRIMLDIVRPDKGCK